jgi:hypothetical protein
MGETWRLESAMPLNLLYSRNIVTDSPSQYTDVPISDRSILVDVLSLVSQFHRVAGWIYPIVPATATSYERLPGTLLLYGKTRIITPSVALPYCLEFFPRYGRRSGVISVYSGTFTPPAPPAEWKLINSYNIELRMAPSGIGIEYRRPPGFGPPVPIAPNAIEGFNFSRFLYWKEANGTYWTVPLVELDPPTAIAQADYDFRRTESTAIVL